MPGETTYYRRVQVLLELSAAGKPRKADVFIGSIVKKSPPNFMYRRWNATSREVVLQCSEHAVVMAFRLACDLGLVEAATGALTRMGQEAVDPARFARVLGRQLAQGLENLGCPVRVIEEACTRLLHKRKVSLPTGDELYNELFVERGLNVSPEVFRRYLRLLAACGGIGTSRQQIYFPAST